MSNIENEDNTFGPFKDLEAQQFEKLYDGYDVPLIDLRKKFFGRFYSIGFFILLLLISLAFLVKIPNYLKVPILIENIEKDNVRLFSHSINVTAFYAKVGDTIIENQEICKISSPDILNLISELQRSENQLKIIENIDSTDLALKVKNLEGELSSKKDLTNSLVLEKNVMREKYNYQRKTLASELEYFKKLEQTNKKLFEKGVVAEFKYLESKNNFINKREELNSLTKEYNKSILQLDFKSRVIDGENIEISNEQKEIYSLYTTEKNTILEQIEFAMNKLKLFYGNYRIDSDGLVLLSKNSGVVTFCYQKNQLLQSGETLYRVESSKGSFEARGYVDPKKIAYIKTNLSAKVILETFPNYEWGNLTGTVNNVSKSPDEKGLFTLNIRFIKDNQKITPLLQNGQTGTGYLLIEEKTLIQYLSSSFKKAATETFY